MSATADTDESHQQWLDEAYGAVRWLAVHRSQFTVNDVWQRLDAMGCDQPNRRKLGPVMQRAERRGLIKRTNQYRNSRIKRQHGRPIPVWRSLIDPQ